MRKTCELIKLQVVYRNMQDRELQQRLREQKSAYPRIKPEVLFLYMGLASVAVLFFALTLTYVYARIVSPSPALQLPLVFHANTVLILVSSFTFRYAMEAAKQDNDTQYIQGLGVTFLLGSLFLLFQYFGWRELLNEGVRLHKDQGGAYVFLISGVHAVHVLGGLVALGVALFRAYKRQKDPVQHLLYEARPDKIMRIKLVSRYWHFVDGLWLYLYVFFLVNMLF